MTPATVRALLDAEHHLTVPRVVKPARNRPRRSFGQRFIRRMGIRLAIVAIALAVGGVKALMSHDDAADPARQTTATVAGTGDQFGSPVAPAPAADAELRPIAGLPALAAPLPYAETTHVRIDVWQGDGDDPLGDPTDVSYDVHFVLGADSGWYTRTSSTSTITVMRFGDQLSVQGIDGSPAWYQAAVDPALAREYLLPFNLAYVETLGDRVPPALQPFATVRATSTPTIEGVPMTMYDLRFDVAAMAVDPAAYAVFTDLWSAPSDATKVGLELGVDADGVVRLELGTEPDPTSPLAGRRRTVLIEYGTTPVTFPEITGTVLPLTAHAA